jgi:hypothetical protein
MAQTLTPSFRLPFNVDGKASPEVVAALRWHDNGLVDLNQAIAALNTKVNAIPSGTTTSTTNATTIQTVTIEDVLAGLGTLNDQTGATSYTTQTQDAGALLVLNDASPVAVSLNSTVSAPFALFITNKGAGTVTLTPTSGTINGGGSLALLTNQTIWVVFSSPNWTTGAFFTPPQNTPAVSHEWITSYNAATGAFPQSQPAFTDISGNLATSQLPIAGLSVTITTAQLTTLGTQGSMTFVNGLLTAQTPAT